ncbi:glucosaminidase domain-containing protein [Candidatus Daviesbacteria bacterium]|nr:glucosaminidase domain-containing protein [Candidatus Daviesbacteria bacterium]
MNKLPLAFAIAVSLIFSQSAVLAKPAKEISPSVRIQAKVLDEKARVLADYFKKYNSPLEYHAQDFIDAANEYDLDWKLVPAISGVESTFGKQIPGGYNAWGWGVYGNQAIYFKSWREGIFEVARGLRENYLDKGLTDPYQMNRVYAASPHWGKKVAFFMKDLDSFIKIAGVSGQPDLR